MRRRTVALGLAGLSALPGSGARAQPSGRLPKVAILSPNPPFDPAAPDPALRTVQALAELGYVDGRTVSLDYRFAGGAIERLPALAAELVEGRPDVLWTHTSGGAHAAASATSTIPIVVAPVLEETLSRLVADLARPTGNVTGLTLSSRLQEEKLLQLLKEVAPRTRRVAVLVNPLNPAWRGHPAVLDGAARALGIELFRVEAHGPEDVEQAVGALVAQGGDALFGVSDSTITANAQASARLAELLAGLRLPAVSTGAGFAARGGLLALSPDLSALARLAADYIHRILEGAAPRDLPVVHPSGFSLAVNLRTAAALGLTVPPAILLRAEEVIE